MATADSPIHRPTNRGDQPSSVELDETECFDLLGGAEVGRLAVQLPGGGIDIFPVNFVLRDGDVLLRTGAGTKLDSVKSEPVVAFEADHFDYFGGSAWSVVIKGHAELVEDLDELFELLDVDIELWHPQRKPFFVRIVPASTTGRRFAIHRRVES
jgi:nitroimidazol reductase NimA-like FMN-containing flavoprotein (pyridoxamine 5'-phosphate oxidase superfamily)